ncbi:30S ribosomal protein S3 [Candidatus Poribacteria bacterium]|nr:30S ribosomal protein S3 [Candidatus Poribacteria bacterium]
MGQKSHPRGLRLGYIETWDSKWYAEKEYADWLHEDLMIQRYVKERMYRAGISRVQVERSTDRCVVHIFTARPGIVIGRRGAEVEALTQELMELTGKNIRIAIEEVKRPELDAQLVAEGIALQLERRAPFRQTMKRAVAAAMRSGAQGIRIEIKGRIAGAEIARKEREMEGRVPLQTLRAMIDYGFAEAHTVYGKIGVKVWISKGEVIGKPEEETEEEKTAPPVQPRSESTPPRRRRRRRRSDRREARRSAE